MPVLIGNGSHPPAGHAGCVEIGLVNSMPDAALEATERQFIELIDAAAGDLPVRLRFFSLPDVPRTARGQRHVSNSYLGIGNLWDGPLDALIVTGAEPRAPALSDEPYWPALAELIDWAEHNTISTIWSCLAAHATVLHLDGVARHALADKCFGIFDCAKVGDHPLLKDVPSSLPVPHSRLNGLRESELVACGYDILTRSARAGVDSFARQGRSLFVFFQGHPEYDTASLLGEYRRDVGRFLRGEREIFPAMPKNYFDAATAGLLAAFRARARMDRREELLADFPLAAAERSVRNVWRPFAACIYRNWLAHLAAQKAARSRTGTVRSSTAPRISSGVAAANLQSGGEALRRAPFIERRRSNDTSGLYSGARDRRMSAQRESIPAE
ncbi:MAG TPA: homoserine O-succinyltransferase [Xanthobacteraceae bacterium]|jgi:homoserine O-succinyltransferase|nr:homoserine O-succinyltransferase [Xanthobacteraceae bacterium]